MTIATKAILGFGRIISSTGEALELLGVKSISSGSLNSGVVEERSEIFRVEMELAEDSETDGENELKSATVALAKVNADLRTGLDRVKSALALIDGIACIDIIS